VILVLEPSPVKRSGSLSELALYPGLVIKVFPLVTRELNEWREAARRVPCQELRKQALSSLGEKAFHCMGGAVFALYNPGRVKDLVRVIVAVQTISDYLDNLSDRVPSLSSYEALMRLHDAMLCALDPQRPVVDFYDLYRERAPAEDGGYLRRLVETSRSTLESFPGYSEVKDLVLNLARLYSELQSRKHLEPEVREKSLDEWFQKERDDLERRGENLTWWELGAASGSTLGMFCLLAFSSLDSGRGISPQDRRALALLLYHTYFPAITGLHILLDYFVDREEDRFHGDLNFTEYYRFDRERLEALERFLCRSLEAVETLRMHDAEVPGGMSLTRTLDQNALRFELLKPWFHEAVIKGLLAMYLSDPKVRRQGLSDACRRLCRMAGWPAAGLIQACSAIRRCIGF